MSSHTSENGHLSKSLQSNSAGKVVMRTEPSIPIGGNAFQFNLYRKQYRNLTKNRNRRKQMTGERNYGTTTQWNTTQKN